MRPNHFAILCLLGLTAGFSTRPARAYWPATGVAIDTPVSMRTSVWLEPITKVQTARRSGDFFFGDQGTSTSGGDTLLRPL